MCEKHDCPIKNKIIKKGLEEALNSLVYHAGMTHTKNLIKTIISMLSSKTPCQTTEYLIQRCNDVINNLSDCCYTNDNDCQLIGILKDELKMFILAN